MSGIARIHKNNTVLKIYILGIVLKLVISPWATGDFIASWGIATSYACDGILLSVVFIQFSRFPKGYLPIFVVFVFTALTYTFSTFLYTNESMISGLINHIKTFLPILLIPTAVSLAAHTDMSMEKIVYGICLLGITLVIIALATFPPSMNRMVPWMPTYFGGLHTTAYVSLIIMYCIHALWSFKYLSTIKAVPIMIALTFLIMFGWGVRTASIGAVIFFAGISTRYFTFYERPLLSLVFPLALAMPLSVLPMLDFAGAVDDMSSGRISMYIEKYHQLSRNTLAAWFIGNGYLSDLILTDVWWWAPKGAHSDFITFLVEGGIFYLGGFFYCIRTLMKMHANLPEKLIVVAILSTSMFSNGVFARPIAAYLLSLVFVIYYCQKSKNKTLPETDPRIVKRQRQLKQQQVRKIKAEQRRSN